MGGRRITLDGLDVPTDEPLSLTKDATIRLEGFGALRIKPGGGVDQLARAVDTARDRRDDGLRRLGFGSVTDVKAALDARAEAEAEAASLTKLLAALAPKGIDSLRQTAENERAALSRPLAEGVMALMEADEASRGRGSAGARRRRHERGRGDDRSGRSAAMHGKARARDLAVLEERALAARIRHKACVSDLAAARARESDDILREKLQEAEKALADAEAGAGRAETDLRSVDAETVRLDFERAESAERTIRADIARLTAEKRELEIELGVLGQGGLGEELGDVQGQIERLEKEKAARDLEAAASRLLLDSLTTAQRESKERWLGPVRDRVRPYLKFLEPDSDIVLNEQTFEIEGSAP